MNVYFISGLAADRGVFKHIDLPGGCHTHYLDWIPPLPRESLTAYALRLAAGIDRSQPFALVGLSLGGMLGVEISRHVKPASLILISSITGPRQLPGYFKAIAKTGLHRFVPVSALKSASLIKRLFTAETSEDKTYLRRAIRESDPAFIRWAIDAVLSWKNDDPAPSCLHIHGSKDEILPLRCTRPTHVISGGGHLMIMNRAGEINAILGPYLTDMLT